MDSLFYNMKREKAQSIACFHFYWQTLSTWETSVLFTCSQGNEGPHFQCSAHSAAFQWVAGVPEMNGELLYQSFLLLALKLG